MKTIEALEEILDLDEKIKELEAQREAVEALLISRIGVGNSIETDAAKYTVVQNTSFTVDFEALIAAKPTWARRVTKKVLDQAKFTKLRQAEMLPPEVVELVTPKLSAAFVKITKR